MAPSTEVQRALERLRAVREAIASASDQLSRAYATTAARDRDPRAIADGRLLGVASTMAFIRTLERTLAERRALETQGRELVGKATLAERFSRPGLKVRVVARSVDDGTLDAEPSPLPLGIRCDARAPSIGLVLAISEAVMRQHPVLLVSLPTMAEATRRALGPLIEERLVDVVEGGPGEIAVRASAGQIDRALVLARRTERDAIQDSVRGALLGFPSDTPSEIAIVPFLYAKDELAWLARQVVREVVAPPGASRGVRLRTGAGWLQRDLFLKMVTEGLAPIGPRPGTPADTDRAHQRAAELRVVAAGDVRPAGSVPWLIAADVDPSGLEGLDAVVQTSEGSDDPRAFLEAVALDRNADHPGHLLSVFAHPMLLERAEFVGALRGFVETQRGVVAVNTRASVAWQLGGPPVGPSDAPIQNAWRVVGVDRVLVDGPFRRRAPEGPRAARWRASFEESPSIGRGAALGVATVFPWPGQ